MSDINLTQEQINAIEYPHNMVITACPGSGKTTVITEKIRGDILEIIEYQGVIGITFTVKASTELKAKVKKNAFNIKNSFFGTIDHFCLSEIIYPFIRRVYDGVASELECISINDIDDSTKVELLHQFNCSGIDTLKSNAVAISEYYSKKGVIFLELIGDLALHVISSSSSCVKYLKARYKCVYIDEYQDSSLEQHSLFKTLVTEVGLKGVVVGDINQSIYEWRGSDSRYILELIESNQFQHFTVSLNHRCHNSITNYSNRSLNNNCNIEDCDEKRVYKTCVNGTQYDVSKRISELVTGLVANSKVDKLGDIAILVRNNSSLNYFEGHLEHSHIIYKDNPLLNKNTFTSKLFSLIISYKLSGDTLITDILSYISNQITLSPAEVKDIKCRLRSIKSANDEDWQELTIELVTLIQKNNLSESEIDVFRRASNDNNILSQYISNNDSIQIMTLHKSKGLEFKIVFLLDLYDWIFPKREFVSGVYEPIFENYLQDLNLHYVGITRAEEYCILMTSTQRYNGVGELKQARPSQFLDIQGLNELRTNF